MKLLLHCCCAPCSISCVNTLRAQGIEPFLFWYNPNIHPYSEYKSRRDALGEFASEFADNEKLKLTVIDEYGLRSFLDEVYPSIEKQTKLERCQKCYKIRLEKTASFAAQEGFSAFTTTLLISPYQDHEAIKRIGEELAAKYGIEFLYKNFRPLFNEGQSAARARGIYMQKYCGCIFSEEERYLKVKNVKKEQVLISHSIFDRLVLLTGKNGLEKLSRTRVLVFGAGGVGSWAAEALVRSGIGKIGIIDNDIVCVSNVNRQIEATTLTLGQPKASALKKRLLEINPECEVTAWDKLFCLENVKLFDIKNADYVIDAIDSLNHKLDLIETVCSTGITLFSSMGMALKMDPTQIKTASVWKTETCPLARLVRQGLRKRGFSGDFSTVFSSEQLPRVETSISGQKQINGSIVTVTASAGLMLASLVIRGIINKK
jgi:hypothetical protein